MIGMPVIREVSDWPWSSWAIVDSHTGEEYARFDSKDEAKRAIREYYAV